MKQLNNFIQEKLKVNSKSKINNYKLSYFPKDEYELIALLKKLIKERGDNADLNDIDVSKVRDMAMLFNDLRDIKNIDVSEWDVSNVENMAGMFAHCENFNSDLSKWDVSNVENMAGMFNNCNNFNSDLSKWNTKKVKTTSYMFHDCKQFDSNLSNWNMTNNDYAISMFAGCKNLKSTNFNKWCINFSRMSMSEMFKECDKKIIPNWYK